MPEVFGFDDSAFVDALEQVAASSRDAKPIELSADGPFASFASEHASHRRDLFTAKPDYDAHVSGVGPLVFGRQRGLQRDAPSRLRNGLGRERIRRGDAIRDGGSRHRPGTAERIRDRDGPDHGVRPMGQRGRPDAVRRRPAKRVLDTLDDARATAEQPHDRPLFTFVHVPSPHGPIVFGAEGEAAHRLRAWTSSSTTMPTTSVDSRGSSAGGTSGKSTYLNSRVLDTVDRHPRCLATTAGHHPAVGPRVGVEAELDRTSRIPTWTNGRPTFSRRTRRARPTCFRTTSRSSICSERCSTPISGSMSPRQPDTIYRWDDALTHLIPISSSFAAPVSAVLAGRTYQGGTIRPCRTVDRTP